MTLQPDYIEPDIIIMCMIIYIYCMLFETSLSVAGLSQWSQWERVAVAGKTILMLSIVQ